MLTTFCRRFGNCYHHQYKRDCFT